MDIKKIVEDAIPFDTCQVKEAGNADRRKQLKKRIEEKILEARDKSEPYKPELEYKGIIPPVIEI